MPQLIGLTLANSQVGDLALLSSLTRLETLDLQINPDLDDLGPLAGLSRLEVIGIDDTSVSDLSPLANLPQLKMFSARNTLISDLSLAPRAASVGLDNRAAGRTAVVSHSRPSPSNIGSVSPSTRT
mgnify:CR=1 FL=1